MEKSSKSKIQNKTAIIYCRAANKQDAKRQQMDAEMKAKELGTVVKAVFIDIIPAQRQTLLRRILYIFRGNRPKKAAKRKAWSRATSFLKDNRIDYAITRNVDRISRNYAEFRNIVEMVNCFGTKVVFYDFDKESEELFKSFLKQAV